MPARLAGLADDRGAVPGYGGLRCPSEVLSLQLVGVSTGRSRQGQRHEPQDRAPPRQGHRIIPLFPELRSELEAIWTPESAGYIVDEKYRRAAMGPQGWRNVNLRTTFEKIIVKAGRPNAVAAAVPQPAIVTADGIARNVSRFTSFAHG